MITASLHDTVLAHERFHRNALLSDSGENLRVLGPVRGCQRDTALKPAWLLALRNITLLLKGLKQAQRYCAERLKVTRAKI